MSRAVLPHDPAPVLVRLRSRRDRPLLVCRATVRPLDQRGTVSGGGAVHVYDFAAVDCRELEETVAGRSERPLLIVSAQPVPKLDCSTVGGADAGNIDRPSAGHPRDFVLAVALVAKGPLLFISAA